MNTYAQVFSPGRENRGAVVLNTLARRQNSPGPLSVAFFLRLGPWWLLPAIVAVGVRGFSS